jgi:hypothetical protein
MSSSGRVSQKLLLEGLSRALFIYLFPGTRHLTLKGGTDFFVSSRSLARELLFSHLIEHSSEMGRDIRLLELNRPGLACLPATDKSKFLTLVFRLAALLMGL